MGDESEKIFEDWSTKHGMNYARLGMNRPPFEFFHTLPINIRYLPDYICEDTSKTVRDRGGPMKYAHCFVEVKGIGKDQLVKMKVDMLDTNLEMEKVFKRPVIYFIFDKMNLRVSFHHSTNDILRIVEENNIEEKRFHEGTRYYPVPSKLLGWHSLGDPDAKSVGH